MKATVLAALFFVVSWFSFATDTKMNTPFQIKNASGEDIVVYMVKCSNHPEVALIIESAIPTGYMILHIAKSKPFDPKVYDYDTGFIMLMINIGNGLMLRNDHALFNNDQQTSMNICEDYVVLYQRQNLIDNTFIEVFGADKKYDSYKFNTKGSISAIKRYMAENGLGEKDTDESSTQDSQQ